MRRYSLRCRSVLAAVLCVGIMIGANATGAAFPRKSVRIIAASPGTVGDATARVMAPRLSERWGQPVIVENRPGAGGTIAAASVAKASADGHTLLMGDVTQLATAQKLYSALPYDMRTAFAPVTLVLRVPLVVTTHPSTQWRTVQDLIAYAKHHPQAINYSSGSVGTPGHLTCALLGFLAGIDIVHVAYKGGPAALTAVISREVHFTSNTVLVAAPHIQAGRLVALAVAAEKRTLSLPEVPTSIEAGIPRLQSTAWVGLVVPARTSREVVQMLNRDILDVVREPSARSGLLAQGGEAVGSSPEEFGAWIRNERVKWEVLIAAIGAKAE